MHSFSAWTMLPLFFLLLGAAQGFAPSIIITRPCGTRLLVAQQQQPTTNQQEQLDKYGPTPETSMEILFDQLLGEDDAQDDFYEQTGASAEAKEKWQTFLGQLKETHGGDMSAKDVSMMFFQEASKS